jgi:hypothetical protein
MARRRQTIHDLLARTQARPPGPPIPRSAAWTPRWFCSAPRVYSSSLAVGTLLDLGASRVTDVIGGFEAWRAAGLPVQ